VGVINPRPSSLRLAPWLAAKPAGLLMSIPGYSEQVLPFFILLADIFLTGKPPLIILSNHSFWISYDKKFYHKWIMAPTCENLL
jgi:hypothetical protein